MSFNQGKLLRLLLYVILFALIILLLYSLFRIPNESNNTDMICLPELLSAAIDLAERGGREIVQVHDQKKIDISVKGETKEGASEYVTQGDKRSHAKIVAGLYSAWPKLNLISEEHEEVSISAEDMPNLHRPETKIFSTHLKDNNVNNKDITVWVDPLDATQEFTEDLTQYVTVMVCVAHFGTPIMGVIHQPFQKKTNWAWNGHGNSDYIKNPYKMTDIDKLRIVVSRSHAGDVEKIAKERLGNQISITPAGGAGYKTLNLLSGESDIYLHMTAIKKWDLCAADALLKQAGGEMSTLQGAMIDYSYDLTYANNKGLLASINRSRHMQILKHLEDQNNQE